MKVRSNGPDHMTKMATMSTFGKTLRKSSPEPEGRRSKELVCSIGDVGGPFQICSNNVYQIILLNLTYFTTMKN